MLSAVIITKNRSHSVQRLLDSLAKQTTPPNEVILVNDGGESPSIKSSLNIKKIDHPKSLGAAPSRNEGVKKAQGDQILILDDDVELEGSDFIQKALNALQDSIGIVFPRKIDVTPQKTFEFSYFEHSLLTGETKGIDLSRMEELLKQGKSVLGPMVYFTKKEIYEKVGGHDVIYGYGIGHSFREESDFQLRLQKKGYQAALAPQSFFKHHIQEGGGHGSAVHKKLFWIGHNQVVYRFRHSKNALIENLFFAVLELPRYSWGSGRLLSYPAGLLGMITGFFSSCADVFKRLKARL